MRLVSWLLVLAVGAAALGVGSARADGTGTTTTSTTTTTTTTTYAPLSRFALPANCVGAGAAALVFSPRSVAALGTPASSLGPSAYGSVVAFDSSSSSGSTCRSAGVTLSSVSLFGGAVSASSVQAVNGRGTVTDLEVDGVAAAATAGATVHVEDWGELLVGATIGRVTAPLVLRLYQAHDGVPAGTAVAVAFGASAAPVAKPRPTQHRGASTQQADANSASSSSARSNGEHRAGSKRLRRLPDFPATDPYLAGGALAAAGQDSPVVSLAMKDLGVPYRWGGASPKTGFDCSGLVAYVFAQLGVYLPHYAAAQYYSPDSVYVQPDRLQPGDLVFFRSDGTRKAPGHVGIYIDDGYIIDAPHTGSSVRIDSLSERWFANQFVGARRIVGASSHLLHATSARAPATVLSIGFRPPIEPLGESLGVAAAGATVAQTASRGSWLWSGAVLGVVLLLLFATRPVVRRLPPDARA